jgi:FMN reductase (NADPH)/FMN reductase [NAD(P)H]
MSTTTNETLDLIDKRTSTRTFIDEPLTQAEKDAIVHAAFRAPTACNLVMYSIIEIDDRAVLDRLVVTCDNQPFIAKAPYVLLFVADFQKWVDLFAFSDAQDMDVAHREPGEGELLMSIADTWIAAQNAAIAAQSMGIGSCYIGDIIENGEEHARVFDLPRYTLPVAMLVFGRPTTEIAPRERQTTHVLMRNTYHRLTAEELAQVSAEMASKFAPHGLKPGLTSYPQDVYRTKFTSEFMHEMTRSAQWWLRRWLTGE